MNQIKGIDLHTKGIIFDFNGTLFWDSDKQEKAWRQYAGSLCGREITDEEFATRIHGRPNGTILTWVTGRKMEAEELIRMGEEKESLYRRLCQEDAAHFHLSPGAVSLLDRLADQRVPRTIATASEIINVRFFIKSFHLERWFDPEAIIYDDGHLPGKPEPFIYEKAARAIGLAPADCTVVEDALSGIESARRAGVGEIIALAPRAEWKLMSLVPGVDRVIESFEDLLG